MDTNNDTHVKKTVDSVLVTLDRCGRHELAATLLRKKVFIALVRTPEIEEYCRMMKEKGEWHSMQHAHYGIVIDTQTLVPEHMRPWRATPGTSHRSLPKSRNGTPRRPAARRQ